MGITGVKYPICDQNDHKNINFSFPPIWLGGGTKFQCTEVRGDKISVHRNKGGTKFQYTAILK